MDEDRLDPFLTKLTEQIITLRDIHINTARSYNIWSYVFIIPLIIITSCNSFLVLLTNVDFSEEKTKDKLILVIGAMSSLSTLFQACQLHFKYEVKAEMFRSAAEQYHHLMIKVQFEQFNHNEKDFIEKLEKRLLEIQSTCKYFAPLETAE
jgi:hypothetical protein